MAAWISDAVHSECADQTRPATPAAYTSTKANGKKDIKQQQEVAIHPAHPACCISHHACGFWTTQLYYSYLINFTACALGQRTIKLTQSVQQTQQTFAKGAVTADFMRFCSSSCKLTVHIRWQSACSDAHQLPVPPLTSQRRTPERCCQHCPYQG